jgi:adenylate cyclase
VTPRDRPGRGSRALVAVVIGALVWLAAVAPPSAALLARADALLWDLALRAGRPRPPPANLAVVAIDDGDIAAWGGWPVDRGRWAELLDRLDAAGARTVVLDVLLEGRPAVDDADARLAAAMRRHGNVLLSVGVTRATAARLSPDPLAERLSYPLVVGTGPSGTVERRLVAPAPALRDAAATLGPSAVDVDPNGGPPALPAGVRVGGGLVPTLAVEAVRRHRGAPREDLWFDPAHGAVLAGSALAPAADGRYRLVAYGPAGHLPTLTGRELATGAPPALQDALVVVGVSAVAAGERFRTAFSPALSGTELLATAIGNLLEGRTLETIPPASGLGLALTLAAAAAASAALARRRAWVSLAVLGGLVALAGFGVQTVLTETRWWLPATSMLAALVLAAVAIEALRLVLVQRAERALADAQRNLVRFFPARVAERLAATPDARTLDRAVEATVMFVDVVNSTARVERLEPAAAMAELRRFATKVEDAVFAEDGTLVAFSGDGAFAAFGAPDPRADAPAAGLRTARRLVAAFADDDLAIGIGLHYGEVLAGIGGGERQLQYTVIGDAVHVASRLEALSRELDAVVIASAAVVDRIDDPRLCLGFERRCGVALRGRDAPVDLAFLPRRPA